MAHQRKKRVGKGGHVAALLWVADFRTEHPAAPEGLGGQGIEDQRRIVKARALKDGVTLPDHSMIRTLAFEGCTPDDRLDAITQFVEMANVDRLYVPAAVFDDLGPVDTYKYAAVMFNLGVELVVCEDQ